MWYRLGHPPAFENLYEGMGLRDGLSIREAANRFAEVTVYRRMHLPLGVGSEDECAKSGHSAAADTPKFAH